jgi:ectoine hydroxylase-related dioxygenase (phytanoyl-CoA dioxygenase family)
MDALTKDGVQCFWNEGFAVIRGLWTPQEVEAMRRGFDRLADIADRVRRSGPHRGSDFVLDVPADRAQSVRIQRVVWCGGAQAALDKLGSDPRLLTIAAALLGTEQVEQLINQAHFKRPGDGVCFPWHQDSVHRRYGTELWTDINGRGSFVEIATAVDAVHADNGPLRFIPGSHRLGHITPAGERIVPCALVDERLAVSPELAAGDAVVFGPYVIHGSGPNHSPTPRRMFLNGFCCPGANKRIYPGRDAGRVLTAPGYGKVAA